LRHYLADFGPALVQKSPATEPGPQKCETPSVLSLRTDLRAADEITFRGDAGQLSVGIAVYQKRPLREVDKMTHHASEHPSSQPPVAVAAGDDDVALFW